MTFFYGSNPLVDTILKRYILENQSFVYTSTEFIGDCDKIVLSVNQDSWPLPDDIFRLLGKMKTYIFYDLRTDKDEGGVKTGFKPAVGNIVMIHFRSLSGIMEDVCKNSLIPFAGTPYCDIHLFFREMSKIFRLKPGTYHLMTGEIPGLDGLISYFDQSEIKSFYQPEQVAEVIQKNGYDLFHRKKRIHIYIPTYYRVEKARQSIWSIIEGVKTSKHECHIYIGDNNTQDPEMKVFFEEIKDQVTIFLSDQNLGKAKMVNLLHSREVKKPEYIFSIDSDMVMIPLFDNECSVNQIDRMIELLERGHNIGLVSSFQTGQSEHWFGRTVEEKKERGYRIGESKNGIGIAGGCICIQADDWDLIKGYEEGYDIYTADDAILMDKVDKVLKKRAIVGIDFPFYHPPSQEDDPGYVKWKQERFQKDGLKYSEQDYKKKDLGVGYYDK